MKTNVKILIAAAATAIAATFSTGASAASIFELHEQHRAELLNFVFGVHGNRMQGNINVGPVYQAPPVYVDPYGGGYQGYRSGRGFERRDHRVGRDGYGRDYGRRDGRGFNR